MADDHDLTASDEAILAALYRGDDQAPAAGTDRAGDPDDALDPTQRAAVEELSSLRGLLRQVRAEGFEVEPPEGDDRGSMASLMAAARAHVAPPKPGLWARLTKWMMPLVAHPALAGATAVVVIGGAAGVLYLRGKPRVARPAASVTRPAPEPRLPPSPITDGDLRDVLGGRPTADRPGPARLQTPKPTESLDERPPRDGRPRPASKGARGEGGAGAGQGTKADPLRFDRAEQQPEVDSFVMPPAGPTMTGSGPHGGVSADAPEDGSKLETANERETVTVDDQPALRPAVTSGGAPTAPPPAPPVGSDQGAAKRPRQVATQLTEEARTAARSGDCAKVPALSKQVAATDAAYHRDVFVRDPDIARCR